MVYAAPSHYALTVICLLVVAGFALLYCLLSFFFRSSSRAMEANVDTEQGTLRRSRSIQANITEFPGDDSPPSYYDTVRNTKVETLWAGTGRPFTTVGPRKGEVWCTDSSSTLGARATKLKTIIEIEEPPPPNYEDALAMLRSSATRDLAAWQHTNHQLIIA